LKQVLMNLISNAGKFTRNGEITVSTRTLGNSETGSFEIAVSDNGIGMTGEQIQRLFQPYQQATIPRPVSMAGPGWAWRSAVSLPS
jgi:signal transduction histidine kinase